MKSNFSLKEIPQRELLSEYSSKIPELNILKLETFLNLIKTTNEINKLLNENFAKFDLSEGKFSIMMLLYRQKDYKLSPIELSRMAEVTKGTITGLINGLEKQGYIERVSNEKDQRSYYVSLSLQGVEILKELLPKHYLLINDIMSNYKEKELNQLISLINKVKS